MKQILLILLILGCTACKKDEPMGPRVIPFSLFFVIKQNGNHFTDSELDKVKLYYFTNNNKNYLSDLEKGSEPLNNLGILSTNEIGFTSGNENIKDYYLEYPNGDIDTIFVDYRHVSEKEAFKNSCYCYYPLEEVRFNGKKAEPDPNITMQRVYVFQKP